MVLRRDLLTIHLDLGGLEASGVFVGGERQSLVVSGWSFVVGSQNPKMAAISESHPFDRLLRTKRASMGQPWLGEHIFEPAQVGCVWPCENRDIVHKTFRFGEYVSDMRSEVKMFPAVRVLQANGGS